MLFTPQSRHPERSAARIYRITDGLWRAVEGPRRCLLADALPSFPATNYRPNQKSHKLRAKPRDLQFRGPFLEMFFDRAQRNGEICGPFFGASDRPFPRSHKKR